MTNTCDNHNSIDCPNNQPASVEITWKWTDESAVRNDSLCTQCALDLCGIDEEVEIFGIVVITTREAMQEQAREADEAFARGFDRASL